MALLAALLLPAALHSAASFHYVCEQPVVVHESYNKTHAWFSQLLIPAGNDTAGQRVLLDFSLGGDGVPCPPPHGPPQNCTQSMSSEDGGRSWSLLSNKWAPNAALPGVPGTDEIVTLGYRQTVDISTNLTATSTGEVVEVARGDCPGGATECVRVLRAFNTTYTISASVEAASGGGDRIGNTTWPSVLVHSGPILPAATSINAAVATTPTASATSTTAAASTTVKTKPGMSYVTSMYGHGGGAYRKWNRKPAVYVVRTDDGGESWNLRSSVKWQPAYGNTSDGPGEPSMARLPDGRLLLVFRPDSTQFYWRALSSDDGESWTAPVIMDGAHDGSGGQWSVRPQLRVLTNGMIVLGGGRPGIKLWVCTDGEGETWRTIDIAQEHNRLVRATRPELLYVPKVTNASSPFTGRADPPNTSSYTSIYEVFDAATKASASTIVVSYDRLANGWGGPPGPYGEADTMVTMRITLTNTK
jgi:hypothetical protein